MKIKLESKLKNICTVNFNPLQKEIVDIEKWLIEEDSHTGLGFYCNWNVIEFSVKRGELVSISYDNDNIGFATWRLTSDKTVRIEICEIKPTYRGQGFGRILINKLLDFLKNRGVFAVDLQCAPKNSEHFWKHIGFNEFPDPPENYEFTSGSNKYLYLILADYLPVSKELCTNETIELWNNEPWIKRDNTLPTYIWNLKFVENTRVLYKPIIHPAYYEWRLRWLLNGKTISDGKIKRFKQEIDYGMFIIIEDLPSISANK